MRPLARGLIAAAFAFVFVPLASAQAWPVKPIRLIVNSAPGSGIDLATRAFTPQLGEALGQTVVVDNRPGAGGTIGIEAMARADPDGYTLLGSPGGGILMAPHLYKLGVDMNRDVVPVTPTARLTIFLVVNPGLPVRNVAELIAHARANPGKLNFGSSGTGSSLH
ncbi:MAG: tripartite tricarboxylate transporter substrate binding protein, partial [Pseudomonadota bacterium]